MLRALYTSGTAMMVQNKRMNVITNNITNVGTVGYKSDELLSRSFRDMMITRINDPYVERSAVGPHNTGIHIDLINTTFEQGPLSATPRETDLAIVGDGFFTVETPDGPRYTRAGNFNKDADGLVCTPEGYPLLGENGPIVVPGEEMTVDEMGNVFSDGAFVDRVRVGSFEDNQILRKGGENLYYTYDGSEPGPSNAQVKQKMLEGSNVDVTDETVRMIEVSRAFETNQRIVRMLDETLQKAVNEIARL
ncbi:flagellar hook-basal body protein [Oscillospiraceae bacterium OttesenSCG-928-F05]|nr:flagellar hook-basal body protein [Oscillospiraceae bacterium OttesenSCG-928-F05]